MGEKTALITGSYGGFGSCLVEIHAMTGGDLILVGRNCEKLEHQAEKIIMKYGVHVETIRVDLAQKDAA